ncbi:Abi-alpha family protein [Flavobacterium pectinovorum]|uniref:Abi-alpha family protein n=1 Tax=Flavobacterium pectinovorum TaxID=29533 RepID=UPI00265EDF98|nr:Abi-alpha family protein [Flavobacterium pectinovorum]WKL47933.1 Abi-alpha family protein [Flavobacterium pectinovorum]
MESTNINISSKAIEKAIDLVGGFIEKLAGSSLEEAGLLLADKIRTRRLTNQIKIFSEAKRIAEENNITVKQINLKLLVPLLEFSSLEEDETLQQKWSNLIVNFSDESQNYESSIFPFILSQLNKNDVEAFDSFKIYNYNFCVGVVHSRIVKDNLLRLGLIELHFGAYNDIPYGHKHRRTELGMQFYNCCSNKKEI